MHKQNIFVSRFAYYLWWLKQSKISFLCNPPPNHSPSKDQRLNTYTQLRFHCEIILNIWDWVSFQSAWPLPVLLVFGGVLLVFGGGAVCGVWPLKEVAYCSTLAAAWEEGWAFLSAFFLSYSSRLIFSWSFFSASMTAGPQEQTSRLSMLLGGLLSMYH